MAGKKVQVPVLGGLRKVIQVPTSQNVGTTIQEFGSQVVSLAQLKAALGITNTKTTTTGGGGSLGTTSLIVGPGMSGGGVLTGAVNIGLLQPISPVVWQDALLPDDWVGSGGSGGGSGGGGSSTLAGLSDVAVTSPASGQVLSYNGSKWANQAPAVNGGSGGWTQIGEIVVGTAVSSVTFSSIPQNFRNLRLVLSATANATTSPQTQITFNGDTGANYTTGFGYTGTGGSGSTNFNNGNSILISSANGATEPGYMDLVIYDYARTFFYKSLGGTWVRYDSTSVGYAGYVGGTWHNTAAITSITLTLSSNQWVPGSVFTLYGEGGGNAPIYIPTGSVFASQGMRGTNTSANNASNYQATILAESTLVAYWPFNDAAASTTVKDAKGTNNGTVSGNPVLFNAPGRIGSTCAYLFSNQYFTGGPVTVNRPVQDDFTLEAWILLSENITGASGGNWYQGQSIIGFDVSGTTNDWAMVLLNGNKLAGGTGNPDVTATGTQNLLDGQWHHVAMTRVKSTGVCTLYVDGASQGTVTGGTQSLNAATTVQIGGFQGFIADVAAYSSALSSTSIQAHYAAGFPGTGSPAVNTGSSSGGNITPDTHPTIATIYDDEFEVGTTIDTAGTRTPGAQAWTGYTANTISSVVAQGALQTITQGSSTSAGAGYAFPVPAGSWTFVWKGLRPAFQVFNLSTWNGYYFGTSGSGNNMLIQHETRNWATGSYTFGGSDTSFSTNGNPAYFMLAYNGTNLVFSWSQSGYNVDFVTLLTVAASTWVVTPDHIGFGTSPSIAVDWIRRTA